MFYLPKLGKVTASAGAPPLNEVVPDLKGNLAIAVGVATDLAGFFPKPYTYLGMKGDELVFLLGENTDLLTQEKYFLHVGYHDPETLLLLLEKDTYKLCYARDRWLWQAKPVSKTKTLF